MEKRSVALAIGGMLILNPVYSDSVRGDMSVDPFPVEVPGYFNEKHVLEKRFRTDQEFALYMDTLQNGLGKDIDPHLPYQLDLAHMSLFQNTIKLMYYWAKTHYGSEERTLGINISTTISRTGSLDIHFVCCIDQDQWTKMELNVPDGTWRLGSVS